MLHIALYEPEIPPNTGNIIRLCANTGMQLHLIHPLGFELDDRRLRRAGLDYHEWARVEQHRDLPSFLDHFQAHRLLAFTTKAKHSCFDMRYRSGDVLLFGPESRGLPAALLASLACEHRLRIPMLAASRSLNLSNAVAVAVYEAWRQLGWQGAS
jgi:tRNA (cytidine/uridine-2'-O-)-methyltransferase